MESTTTTQGQRAKRGCPFTWTPLSYRSECCTGSNRVMFEVVNARVDVIGNVLEMAITNAMTPNEPQAMEMVGELAKIDGVKSLMGNYHPTIEG